MFREHPEWGTGCWNSLGQEECTDLSVQGSAVCYFLSMASEKGWKTKIKKEQKELWFPGIWRRFWQATDICFPICACVGRFGSSLFCCNDLTISEHNFSWKLSKTISGHMWTRNALGIRSQARCPSDISRKHSLRIRMGQLDLALGQGTRQYGSCNNEDFHSSQVWAVSITNDSGQRGEEKNSFKDEPLRGVGWGGRCLEPKLSEEIPDLLGGRSRCLWGVGPCCPKQLGSPWSLLPTTSITFDKKYSWHLVTSVPRLSEGLCGLCLSPLFPACREGQAGRGQGGKEDIKPPRNKRKKVKGGWAPGMGFLRDPEFH